MASGSIFLTTLDETCHPGRRTRCRRCEMSCGHLSCPIHPTLVSPALGNQLTLTRDRSGEWLGLDAPDWYTTVEESRGSDVK